MYLARMYTEVGETYKIIEVIEYYSNRYFSHLEKFKDAFCLKMDIIIQGSYLKICVSIPCMCTIFLIFITTAIRGSRKISSKKVLTLYIITYGCIIFNASALF